MLMIYCITPLATEAWLSFSHQRGYALNPHGHIQLDWSDLYYARNRPYPRACLLLTMLLTRSDTFLVLKPPPPPSRGVSTSSCMHALAWRCMHARVGMLQQGNACMRVHEPNGGREALDVCASVRWRMNSSYICKPGARERTDILHAVAALQCWSLVCKSSLAAVQHRIGHTLIKYI